MYEKRIRSFKTKKNKIHAQNNKFIFQKPCFPQVAPNRGTNKGHITMFCKNIHYTDNHDGLMN